MNESGELIVSGKNHVEIELHKRPHHVVVCFKDGQQFPSCNPNHYDDLEWRVHEKHRKFYLEIKWDVSGSRIIFWKAQ